MTVSKLNLKKTKQNHAIKRKLNNLWITGCNEDEEEESRFSPRSPSRESRVLGDGACGTVGKASKCFSPASTSNLQIIEPPRNIKSILCFHPWKKIKSTNQSFSFDFCRKALILLSYFLWALIFSHHTLSLYIQTSAHKNESLYIHWRVCLFYKKNFLVHSHHTLSVYSNLSSQKMKVYIPIDMFVYFIKKNFLVHSLHILSVYSNLSS